MAENNANSNNIIVITTILILAGSGAFIAQNNAVDSDFALPYNPTIIEIDLSEETEVASGNSPHLIITNPEKEFNEELFVWLPGTNIPNSVYQNLLLIPPYLGYRTIGLSYPRKETVFNQCQDSDVLDECYEAIRQETIYGVDATDNLEVTKENSIEGRLLELLQWLNAENPNQGWDSYYSEEGVTWEKIIVGGHSQGAGNTLYLAKDQNLARAISFSNPGDQINDQGSLRVPAWSLEPKQTPPESIYAIFHEQEYSSLLWPEMLEVYELDQFGPIANVESGNYGNSHVLSMSYLPQEAQELTLETGLHSIAHNTVYKVRLNEEGKPDIDHYVHLFSL